jgi:Tol biopolymer transport system component
MSDSLFRPVRKIRALTAAASTLLLCAIFAAMPSLHSIAAPARGDDLKARIEQKGREVQEKFPVWQQAGGDPNRIGPLGQKVDRYLKEGKLAEAEATLDEILAIIGGSSGNRPAEADTPPTPSSGAPPRGALIGSPRSVQVKRIPSNAEIIYHAEGRIYCMDSAGKNQTQLTNEKRRWEHVAASFDRRYVAANGWPSGGGASQLWVFDLEQGTETQLLPNFLMAGNGGVAFDPAGYIYFAAVESKPYPNPKRREEFMANEGANDVYRIRPDGTGLQRLTRTPDRGEADVSVSEDGKLITFMATKIDPVNPVTEIWVANSDGSNRRMVCAGGKDREGSVHDPEISPDGTKVIFSKVNSQYRNFRSDPNANTAHDLWVINIDGSGLTRLTPPGPISIVPSWKRGKILYLELTDQGGSIYRGVSVMNSDGSGRKRICEGANIARWIP